MEQSIAQAAEMSLEECLVARRSVRGFLEKPLPQALMNRVFSVAQHAPSNCNVQPWIVLVASGEARDRIRSRLLDAVTTGAETEPDFGYTPKFEGEYRRRQIECAVAMYSKMGIGRDDKEGRARASLRNFELFDAPHVAFIGMHKDFGESVAIDVGMYVQSLMLSLTAHGLASCAQATMRYYPHIVRDEFPGNEDTRILCGMSFGYEDTALPVNETRTTRDDISACVTFKED